MSPIAILPIVNAALDTWRRVSEARAAAASPAAAGFNAEFQKALGSQPNKAMEQLLLELPEVRSLLSAMPAKDAQLVLSPQGALSLRVAGWGEQQIQLGTESQALVKQWLSANRVA